MVPRSTFWRGAMPALEVRCPILLSALLPFASVALTPESSATRPSSLPSFLAVSLFASLEAMLSKVPEGELAFDRHVGSSGYWGGDQYWRDGCPRLSIARSAAAVARPKAAPPWRRGSATTSGRRGLLAGRPCRVEDVGARRRLESGPARQRPGTGRPMGDP